MTERTIAEAAAQLGVSADTGRWRTRDGALQARKDADGWLLVQLADIAGRGPASGPECPRTRDGDTDALLSQITAERDRLAEQVRFLSDQATTPPRCKASCASSSPASRHAPWPCRPATQQASPERS